MRGLPWSATKEDVKDFFHNVTILNGLNGIHFILEEKHLKNGRAFVQLEQYCDLVSALKYNRKSMNDRYIEGIIWLLNILNKFNAKLFNFSVVGRSISIH